MRQGTGETERRILPFEAARRLVRRPEVRPEERGQVLLFTGIRYERMPDEMALAAFRPVDGGQPASDHGLRT